MSGEYYKSITGASKIIVSAINFPEFSKERSKMRINPDLKPIATLESNYDEVNFRATSLFVVNSVTTSIVSAFQM